MSDEEWQRWMATYAKEGRPIPPVMGRARTDRRRALIGLAGVYALAGFLVLSELPELRGAVRVWSVATGTIDRSFHAHDVEISALVMDSTGTLLATAGPEVPSPHPSPQRTTKSRSGTLLRERASRPSSVTRGGSGGSRSLPIPRPC